MRKTLVVMAVALVASAAPAWAQDFGVEWIDRVSHELQQERGPLKPKAVDFHALGGVAYYYDSNVFLEEDNEDSDSVIIPFAGGRFEYAEPRFAIEADLLANYKYYSDLDDARDDEQRFYVHARQADSRYAFDITQIVQRVSDPLDSVFLERVSRVVSNTVPTLAVDINSVVALEAGANYQIVRFEDDLIGNSSDNDLFRVEGALVYRTKWGLNLVAQGGYFNVAYANEQVAGAAPDSFGYFGHGGIRGELLPRLQADILVGWASVESDYFLGTNVDRNDDSGSAVVHLRYEASERVVFTGDYTRMYTFGVQGDPWQRVNAVRVGGQFQATDEFLLKVRLQADNADSALGVERDYIAAGASASYKLFTYRGLTGPASAILEAGGTWRTGETSGNVASSVDFDGFIIHVGLALNY